MKRINTSTLIILLSCVVLLLVAGWIYLQKRQFEDGLDVNCSSPLNMTHMGPDFNAKLDISFRLLRDFTGQVSLSGEISTTDGKQFVSRTVKFEYSPYSSDELAISEMRYIKNARDTASDEIFEHHMLFVPDGGERYIKISPINNAYLIQNLHSPILLCVDKPL